MDVSQVNQVGSSSYIYWWSAIFNGLLFGMWSKVFATIALLMSGWFGLRARNLSMMFILLLVAAALAFSATFFKFFNMI